MCASGTDCIIFHRKIAGSQVYGHKELKLYLCGLNLAAIHEQGGMAAPFLMHPGSERREGTLSWQNLVQLSDTNALDDTHGGCHMVMRIGT